MMEKPFSAYAGDETYIFVCYAHHDDAVVYEELRRLHDDGVNIWYDEGIAGGTIWRAELAQAIDNATVILFYVSPESVQSEPCNRELNYALERNIPILPVYLEDTELPGDLLLGLARVQALHRHELPMGTYREKLLEALQSDYDRTAPLPRRRRRIPLWIPAAVGLALLTVVSWFVSERDPLLEGGPITSLAVLPFHNLSGDPEQAYLAAGLQDALIGTLAQISSLRVISRTSTQRYRGSELSLPEIARELNVAGIIEASVMRLQDQVRVQVQLVRAFPQEEQLWSGAYERKLSDVLSMLNEVATAVAGEIEVSLTEGETERLATARTVNPKTYEAYLRGSFYLNQSTVEGAKKGLAILHEAVANDPADPFAYAALALGYISAGHGNVIYVDIHDPWPRAKSAALQALKLDPTMAEAHAALAEVKVYADYDWVGAEELFKRALELNPNLAQAHYHYGWHLAMLDREDEAEVEMRLAQELDPLVLGYTVSLGGWYWTQGRYDDALEEVLKSFEFAPDSVLGNFLLGRIYAYQGNFDAALAAQRAAMQAANVASSPHLGIIYTLAGRQDDAQAVLDQLSGPDVEAELYMGRANPFGMAELHAVRGDKDAAFRSLDAAFAAGRRFTVPEMKINPNFSSLRDDSRYEAMLRRVNLSP